VPLPSRARVLAAIAPSVWDPTNRVLYDLCRKTPDHTAAEGVLAKILLIGRAYAAAIERRRNKDDNHFNEDFYVDTVAPAILASDVDTWLCEARSVAPGTEQGLRSLVRVHGETTKLFEEISGLDKRSLASKYLHFHVPKLFYIFDARAVSGIREFSDVLPRASRNDGRGDNEYRKFAEKCSALVLLCKNEYGLVLSPRQLDNVLLDAR
jgi:hypothetical protein